MKKSLKLYNFLTALLGGVFKVMFRVKVTGRENETIEGNAIYCANHMSNWDPVLVACMTKQPINFMAKKELFNVPVLKSALKSLGVFPIDRGGNDLATLRSTIANLKDGATICMFPQGTRCPGAEPSETELKGGVAMLAKYTKASVVPIGIYTKEYKIKLFRKVYLSIGKPIPYEELGFTGDRDDNNIVTKNIFNNICELCNQSKEEANGKSNKN